MKDKFGSFYWLKSGFLTIMQNMAGVLFGFGGFYLLVRVLSKHDFGVWTLYMSTITILEIVRGGLVQNALIKFISGSDSSEHEKIVSASFIVSGGLTLLCIVLNLLLAPWLASLWKAPELVKMFYAFNIMYILSGVLSQFNCIEQANLNYSGVFVSSFVRQALFFAYVLFCFLINVELNLLHLVYMQIIAALVSLLVAGYYVRQHLSFKFTMSMDWVKKLFHYGKYAFGTSVSSILSGTIDQMMLGALLSPVASAAYNVAVRIVNLVDIPTNAIATIVFPQSAKRLESEGPAAVKYLYEKSVGTILAIFIPGLLLIFFLSGYVVEFIAGGKYADTVPLLKITVFYCLLIPFGRQCGTVLDSAGKTRVTFSIVLLTASLNLVLNYFFIKRMGVTGAAYATLLSNIVGFVIGQVVLYRELKVNAANTLLYALQFYPEFINKYLKQIVARNR